MFFPAGTAGQERSGEKLSTSLDHFLCSSFSFLMSEEWFPFMEEGHQFHNTNEFGKKPMVDMIKKTIMTNETKYLTRFTVT